ncbi:MAG TPA: VOC family protein [Bryobacteraceae bacterium]|nr:VOC family protein [Bryobacteraceae bacterium]
MRAYPILGVALLSSAGFAQTIGMNNWIHATADLDKTVQFYVDVFGVDKPAPPRPPNPAVPGLLNVPGVVLHVAILRFPGSAFGFELTYFGDAFGPKASRPRPTDPGAASLIVFVRDIDPVFAALKKAGAPFVTRSGAPVKNAENGHRNVIVRDPDGYFVLVEQVPPRAESPAGNLIGASMQLMVSDTQSTMNWYHDFLGFDLAGTTEFSSSPRLLDLVNLPAGAEIRGLSTTVPGTKARMYFYEFKGVERTPFRHRVPDPGTPAIALRVTDLDGLLARMKAAGTPVISAGGVPAQFSPTIRNIFVEDPSGFKIELYEQK